ncbi:unnamed protein product [Polarella glacialis]|uniref:Protein kinase domain-containing protein n=1 Tax=Polarella glacialis TaxID=89957 RepID=A0A813KQQ3_POLGL|nr:unnamed protein product [Polarella glacialis]
MDASYFPLLWLHPVHQRQQQPQAWTGPGNAAMKLPELALQNLVARAALGVELSVAALEDQLIASSGMSADSVSRSDSFSSSEVVLGKRHLNLLPDCRSKSALEPCHAIPLLLADIVWVAVPEACRTSKGTFLQWLLGQSTKAAMAIPCTTAVVKWMSASTGDSGSFQSLLLELGSRGAIRWDFHCDYRLSEKPVASGFSGAVYTGEARSRAGYQKVAVKYLNQNRQNPEELIRSEVGFLAQCRAHPNIIRLLGVVCSQAAGADTGKPESSEDDSSEVEAGATTGTKTWGCVMEFCERGDLQMLLKTQGALPREDAFAMACGLMSALSHLHFLRVVHRDVKAENVLLGSQGQAILADFGTAAYLHDDVAMAKRLGSPGYAAPEIINGEPYGVKVDAFSSGVLLYLMFSGRLPFPGPSPAARVRQTLVCSSCYVLWYGC